MNIEQIEHAANDAIFRAYLEVDDPYKAEKWLQVALHWANVGLTMHQQGGALQDKDGFERLRLNKGENCRIIMRFHDNGEIHVLLQKRGEDVLGTVAKSPAQAAEHAMALVDLVEKQDNDD